MPVSKTVVPSSNLGIPAIIDVHVDQVYDQHMEIIKELIAKYGWRRGETPFEIQFRRESHLKAKSGFYLVHKEPVEVSTPNKYGITVMYRAYYLPEQYK